MRIVKPVHKKHFVTKHSPPNTVLQPTRRFAPCQRAPKAKLRGVAKVPLLGVRARAAEHERWAA